MPSEIFKITSAGSVDDGKSTILARLLIDTGSIFEDQLGKGFDPLKIADLLDGLESEREQGITIDVAHRFFDSKKRRYQIADSPGHEQYTRNMATACAGSDALLLVVDATVGLKQQTMHHLEIARRFGIGQVLFAVNKMDLVGFKKKAFEEISAQISEHMSTHDSNPAKVSFSVIPVSGLHGSNVVHKHQKLSWFHGPTLLEALDGISNFAASTAGATAKTLVQVQYVQRLQGGGRRYLGPLLSGHLTVGQTLRTSSSEVTVSAIHSAGKKVQSAKQGEQISIELDKQVDLQRGQLLSSEALQQDQQFEVDLIWLSGDPGHKSRKYILKSGSRVVSATISRIYQLNLQTNEKAGEIQGLEVNQIARVTIHLSEAIPLTAFTDWSTLGSLILIDPDNGQTVGVATVNFALHRSQNITQQDYQVSNQMLASLTGNNPKVLWFTGLSGSGKSTIANELSGELFKLGRPHAVLDGDNLRLGINKDLGFSEQDRTENIRRTAEVAKLMVQSGLIVLVALVSPLDKDREVARSLIGEDLFSLIFVDTPLEVCESRDPKGLYKKAREGNLPNFTGISAEFERPHSPDFVVSSKQTLGDCEWSHWLD